MKIMLAVLKTQSLLAQFRLSFNERFSVFVYFAIIFFDAQSKNVHIHLKITFDVAIFGHLTNYISFSFETKCIE